MQAILPCVLTFGRNQPVELPMELNPRILSAADRVEGVSYIKLELKDVRHYC